MEELGIRPLVWYAFRHFYASAIAAAGYTIHDLARWMGHENIQLTYDTYMHLFPDSHDMANLDLVAATAPLSRIASIRQLDRASASRHAAMSEAPCKIRTRLHTGLDRHPTFHTPEVSTYEHPNSGLGFNT